MANLISSRRFGRYEIPRGFRSCCMNGTKNYVYGSNETCTLNLKKDLEDAVDHR